MHTCAVQQRESRRLGPVGNQGLRAAIGGPELQGKSAVHGGTPVEFLRARMEKALRTGNLVGIRGAFGRAELPGGAALGLDFTHPLGWASRARHRVSVRTEDVRGHGVRSVDVHARVGLSVSRGRGVLPRTAAEKRPCEDNESEEAREA